MTFSQLLLDPVSLIELVALALATTQLVRVNFLNDRDESSKRNWLRSVVGVGKILQGGMFTHTVGRLPLDFAGISFSGLGRNVSRSLVGVGVMISEPKRSLQRQRF